MTTEDGTKAPTVRLVPLLVANLTMVLLGITAAANLQPAKWYIFAMALCFGGHVFSPNPNPNPNPNPDPDPNPSPNPDPSPNPSTNLIPNSDPNPKPTPGPYR